jgi:nitroreductase
MECMSLSEAMLSRKSIRGFTPDAVPASALHHMIELAIQSPSASNAQPWEIAVVSGPVLAELNRLQIGSRERGEQVNPDVAPADLFGEYMQRRREVGKQVFELLGIRREDRDAREQWNRKALRFFDAPVGIFIYTEGSLERSRTDFDLGILTEALCLAAMCHGLGTCIDQQAMSYPQVIKPLLSIPESKRITAAIAVGYPDWEFAANKLESSRAPVDVISTWHGFDGE